MIDMRIMGTENMREEYDFSNGTIKNYSDKMTREEKLKAFLDCFIAVEKITKEELKREVDAILA